MTYRSVLPRIDPAFTGNSLDRADLARGDLDRIGRFHADPQSCVLPLWSGKPMIDLAGAGETSAQLAWRPLADAPHDSELTFLGLEGPQGHARFTFELFAEDEEEALARLGRPENVRFIDLRSISKDLSVEQAAIAAEAKSMTDWRRSHRHCARCGGPLRTEQSGWRLACDGCGATHFPRTDPVVIMLATRRGSDGEDRVIIGRPPHLPPNLFSLLAGFVEPGENIEEAARREMHEEAGVEVGDVVYLASQPWPFPSTLMIAVWAEVLGDELTPDYTELEACRWATRADVRAAAAGAADWAAPRTDAIASTLLRRWADGAFDSLAGAE